MLSFNSESAETKNVEFANSIDPDEAHQGIHCLPSTLKVSV